MSDGDALARSDRLRLPVRRLMGSLSCRPDWHATQLGMVLLFTLGALVTDVHVEARPLLAHPACMSHAANTSLRALHSLYEATRRRPVIAPAAHNGVRRTLPWQDGRSIWQQNPRAVQRTRDFGRRTM